MKATGNDVITFDPVYLHDRIQQPTLLIATGRSPAPLRRLWAVNRALVGFPARRAT